MHCSKKLNALKGWLARVLMGLGIRLFGERTRSAAEEFAPSTAQSRQRRRAGARRRGGPRISQAILEFFAQPANQTLIETLLAAGVEMTRRRSSAQHSWRDDFRAHRHAAHAHTRRAKARIEAAAKTASSVSKKTATW